MRKDETNARRTMIVLPKDTVVWLAGQKVLTGATMQQIIGAAVAYIRRHNLLDTALEEDRRGE